MSVTHLSTYRFIPLTELPNWQGGFTRLMKHLLLKGTILLSDEGINIAVAGAHDKIKQFIQYLKQFSEFKGMLIKLTQCSEQPFKRIIVRTKPEIITTREKECWHVKEGNHLSPKEYKKWYLEGKSMRVIDVRNRYEVEYGTYQDAIYFDIDQFSEFNDALISFSNALSPEEKEKPVVILCTGGVRCEKAEPMLRAAGFQNVFQLAGGILNYFAECGQDFYEGHCFTFDERFVVKSPVTTLRL